MSPADGSGRTRTAVVLAGGLGTRLRSATDVPKVVAPVAGRPFLSWLLDPLAEVAVGEPRREEIADDQGREERLDAILLEAECGGPLAVNRDGLGDLGKGVRAELAIVAVALESGLKFTLPPIAIFAGLE